MRGPAAPRGAFRYPAFPPAAMFTGYLGGRRLDAALDTSPRLALPGAGAGLGFPALDPGLFPRGRR